MPLLGTRKYTWEECSRWTESVQLGDRSDKHGSKTMVKSDSPVNNPLIGIWKPQPIPFRKKD